MQAPSGGWLHDDSALTAGNEGIFYSFPVFVREPGCALDRSAFSVCCVTHSRPRQYCGSLELGESLRLLDMNSQTELTRYGVTPRRCTALGCVH